MKITYIEPYLGFSHKEWIEGYKKHSVHEVEVIGLPARFWKWRMHGGAISLAEMVNQTEAPDLFLVSGMIDLPLFKSMLLKKISQVPMALYFHENQFAYPPSEHQLESHTEHFNFINMKSALVADKVYFNSSYNKETLLEGSINLIKKMPDFASLDWVEKIKAKSKVLPLGMNFLETENQSKKFQPPMVLWNHRWEYDKNPAGFFKALKEVKSRGVKFRLAVLGESFRSIPKEFEEAKSYFKDEIAYWGFQEREKYIEIVEESSFLPVTSKQDFFGLSVVEAAAAGVRPLLPRRLAYPEHFSDEYFYENDEKLVEQLCELLKTSISFPEKDRKRLLDYSWEFMAVKYDEEFSSL